MATLALRFCGDGEEPYVEFFVDGEDLGARIVAALGDDGFDDVLPWFGGDYRIEETVLGEKALREGARGALMLACGCGYSACGGVWADVTVDAGTITLSKFTTWRRGGEVVAAVGPVWVDRRAFESAVAEVRRAAAAWRPASKGEVPGRVLLTPPPEPGVEGAEGG